MKNQLEMLSGHLVSLLEVGRKISAERRKKILAALTALQDILGEEPADEAQREAALAEARSLLEAEMSFNDRERLVRDAIRAMFAPDGSKGVWVWVVDCFDTYAIANVEQDSSAPLTLPTSKAYKVSYAVVDGVVTLGEPVEVRKVVTYEPLTQPASEAGEVEITGDLVPLLEKALRKDGTVAVKVIQPGWGSSGYYGPEVLKRDGPKVFTKGLHMHVDHPTAAEEAERPERSVNTIGAVLTADARWEENGPAGPGLYAEAKPLGAFKERLAELAPHIGVSIRALGKAKHGEADGRKGPVIESIAAAKSVDFVTVPGAGGRVLELFEAARGGRANTSQEVSQVDEKEAQALREAMAKLEADNKQALEENAGLRAKLLRREASDIAAAALAPFALPASVAKMLTEHALADLPRTESGDLDEVALRTRLEEAAGPVVADLGKGSGRITGMGSTGADPAGSDRKRLVEAYTETFRRQGETAERAAQLAEIAAR